MCDREKQYRVTSARNGRGKKLLDLLRIQVATPAHSAMPITTSYTQLESSSGARKRNIHVSEYRQTSNLSPRVAQRDQILPRQLSVIGTATTLGWCSPTSGVVGSMPGRMNKARSASQPEAGSPSLAFTLVMAFSSYKQ